MTVVLLVAGSLVLLLTLADTVTTVLRVETHSGPITRRLSGFLWRLSARIPTRKDREGPPAVAGVAITLAILLAWFLLVFLGWYLIFSASSQAVVHADTGAPADVWARAYFTAYAISTLGIGDYVPGGAGWQVLTGVAASGGLAFATLIITYMASLTSAVAHKRRLARAIHQLGDTPTGIVRRGWNGDGFEPLVNHLMSLTADLNGLAEQHLTYPVLYFYRPNDREMGHWPAVATLDEVLLILDEMVESHVRPATLVVEPARAAVRAYLDTVPASAAAARDEPPPPPPLDALRETGIPLRSHSEIAEAVQASADRRGRLAGVLRYQGWDWQTAVR